MLCCQLGFLSVRDLSRLASVSHEARIISNQSPQVLWEDAMHCTVTTPALAQLLTCRASSVLVLRLHQCQQVTEAGFKSVGLCAGLRELVLTDATQLTDGVFVDAVLPGLRRLTKLDLAGAEIGNESLLALARACPQLMSLSVAGCVQVTSVPQDFQHLQWLDLSETSVADSGIVLLERLHVNLRHLFLSNTEIGDESIVQMVAGLQQLSTLDVSYTHVTSEVVAALSAYCPQIQTLNISGCSVSNEALDTFARSAVNLVSLCATDLVCGLSTALVTIAECCQKLETLSLSNCHCVYEYALQMVRKLGKRVKNFFVFHCFWFDNHMLRVLLGDPVTGVLEHLGIVNTNVTDIDLCDELVQSAGSLHTIGVPHYVYSHGRALKGHAAARNITVYSEADTHDDDCSSCRDLDFWYAVTDEEGSVNDMSWHSWSPDDVYIPPRSPLTAVSPLLIPPLAGISTRVPSVAPPRDEHRCNDADGSLDDGDKRKEDWMLRSQCHSDELLPLPHVWQVLVHHGSKRRRSAPACLGEVLHNLHCPVDPCDRCGKRGTSAEVESLRPRWAGAVAPHR